MDLNDTPTPGTQAGQAWLIDLTVRSGGEALAAEWALEVNRRICKIEAEAARAAVSLSLAVMPEHMRVAVMERLVPAEEHDAEIGRRAVEAYKAKRRAAA